MMYAKIAENHTDIFVGVPSKNQLLKKSYIAKNVGHLDD
jgi:hypothetical protein